MPVLVNSQTGNAENFPDEQAAAAAVQAGTHGIPLIDPNGNPATAASDEDAAQMLAEGYSQPSPQQLQQGLDYAQYSTLPQEAAAVGEGALSTLPLGVGTAAEEALGVSPEGINKRAAVNPGLRALGQVGGVTAQALIPGVGEVGLPGLMGAAGEGIGEGAAALGIGKVGSAAAKLATENAIFQANDEASKLISGDPSQTAESAIDNIGLAGIVGGVGGAALEGAISPIWEATKKAGLLQTLGKVIDKVNGVSDGIIAPTLDNAAQAAGVELTPDIRYALGAGPEGTEDYQNLIQSETKAGLQLKQSRDDLLGNLRDSVISALGTTPDQLDALTNYSDNQAGQDIQNTLIGELRAKQSPLAEQFQNLKEQYSQVPVSDAKKAVIANQLNDFAQAKGFHLTPGDAQMGLVNKVIASLPNVETAADLNKVISNSLNLSPTADGSLLNAASGVRGILRNAVDDSIVKAATDIDPGLADQYQAARQAYAQQAQDREYLSEVLHPGKSAGPDTFAQRVSEMEPEQVLSRITAQNRAGFSDFLAEKFPQTAQKVLDAQKADILWKANQAAKEGDPISLKKLYSLLDGMSPELRNKLFSPDAQARIAGARQLEAMIPPLKNPSGTAGMLDRFFSRTAAGLGAMMGMLSGGGWATRLFGLEEGFAGGALLGRWATRSAPDAYKLMTMKILGSQGAVDANAFIRGAAYISHAIESDNLLTKGAKAVFSGAEKALPKAFMATPQELLAQRKTLDRAVDVASRDPSSLMNVGGELGRYLPDHQAGVAAAAARAVQYLASIKPRTTSLGPMDQKKNIPKVQQQAYDRALDLANNPRRIFSDIKDGTLTVNDMQALNAMYPNFMKKAQAKLMEASVSELAGGKEVPLPTKIAISKFLASPVDTNLIPQSVLTNQQSLQGPQLGQQAAPKKSRSTSSMVGIRNMKIASRAATQTSRKDDAE